MRKITTAAENMSLSGSIVTISTGASISTQAGASTMVSIIQASLTNVDSALAKLSSGSKKFSIQLDFAQKLSDSLKGGIGVCAFGSSAAAAKVNFALDGLFEAQRRR